MRSPFRETQPDHFCRLFPPSKLKDADRRAALSDLGAAMFDPGKDGGDLDAGYTYFGQFIDHDLTKMDPLQPPFLRRTWRKLWARLTGTTVVHSSDDLRNLQTPRLDLGHLYGAGPLDGESQKLYQPDKIRLLVGDRTASGRSFDVYVDPSSGRPVLADDRSTENVIIRQMAALFARLHNAAVDQWADRISDSTQLYEQAREQTVWQFQYLVVKDFLKNVLDRQVFSDVFEEGKVLFEWRTFSIPVEFAVAAFRFGHSMVRPAYILSTTTPPEDVALTKLLERALMPGPLGEEWEIKWGRFFSGVSDGSSFAVTAQSIDTLITKPLHELEDAPELMKRLIHLFPVAKLQLPGAPRDHFKLPVRTLLRGESMRLASGQTAANMLGETPRGESDLIRPRPGTPKETPHEPILRRGHLLSDTPLWYYILKESEIASDGRMLGPVGSRIVAETISGSLRYDRSSYFYNPYPIGSLDWKTRNRLLMTGPPVWWQIGRARCPIFSLFELFNRAAELPTQ